MPLEEDEGGVAGSHHVAEYTPLHQPPFYAPHMSTGPSNSLNPLPHPPMDLLLIISLPTASALPSTAALRLRVIKVSLDFVLASLSSRDRLSLVTFEVGLGGPVRKTPFLSPSLT